MKIGWAVALLTAGLLAGWLIWGRQTPPPPQIITVTHTDTLPRRVDTVKIASPALLAETNRLRGVVAGFLAHIPSDTTDTCIVYLTASLTLLDSLRAAITAKPSVRLTLADSLTVKRPIQAFWVVVTYRAEGDTAVSTWDYRLYPAPLAAKSRLGAVMGYGAGCGGFVGAQVRVDETKALLAVKTEKGWGGALVWYLK